MSVRATRAVLDGAYPRGGTHLVVLLVLADHADDAGANIWPSVGRVARVARCSARQVRRILRDLEADGVIEPDGSAAGGRPGSTRRWRLRLDLLGARPAVFGAARSGRGHVLVAQLRDGVSTEPAAA
ncbi:MAG: hypothetical protein AMXMBFR72_32040 [Betaproteobacteria bacterium]